MTSTPEDTPRPLALLGCLLLGFGLATRLLVSQSSGAMESAVPTIVLATGAGVVFLEAFLRNVAGPRRSILLLLLALLPGFFPLEVVGALKGFDFLVAILAGLALRHLALTEGLGSSILRALCCVGALIAVLALCEALYQRVELREQVGAHLPSAFQDATGRAFLASNRPASSFINPNTLAGFFLLLLPVAILLPSFRKGSKIVFALLFVAFLATRSLGATLAGGLALGSLRFARPPLVKDRGHRISTWVLRLSIAVIALVVTLRVSGFSPELLNAKLTSFGARLDYHAQALRLIPRSLFDGLGFEAFGEAASEVRHPDETWSRYVHDSWLQILVECGLLALVPAFLLFRALRESFDPRGEVAPAPRHPGCARSLGVGVLLGAFVAPTLTPLLTPFPLSWALANSAIANGLVCALLVAVSRIAFETSALEGRRLRLALAFSLFASAVHNTVDFDLHIANFSLAFAAICACTPFTSPSRTPRTIPLALAGLAFLIPLLIAPIALQRIDTETALAALSPESTQREAALELLLRTSRDGIPDRDGTRALLQSLIAERRWEEGNALLERLPRALRERTSIRALEGALVYQRARGEARRRDDALKILERLLRPGERLEARLRGYRALLLRQMGHPEAPSEARRALEAAKLWNLEAEGFPELPLIRRTAGPPQR